MLGGRRKNLEISIANTSSEYGIWSYGEKHFSGTVLKDVGLQRPKSQRGDFFYIENIMPYLIFQYFELVLDILK
jgi:iron complex transport system substrate-binding protein